MKLFYAPTSPYARKVRVLLHEKAISGIEHIAVSPFDLPPDLLRANPLSKVPCLLLEDGTALYDSPVITEYLDDASSGSGRWLPAQGQKRWTVLRRCALADGLIDTCLSFALETLRRPEEERSRSWIDRWCVTMLRVVRHIEHEIDAFGRHPDISHIALGCALAYLDLRAAGTVCWRDGNPKLADWYETFSRRPSMTATAPA